MGAANHIVVPTALGILSLRAAALTVGLARQLDILDRIRGIVVTNAKRPLSRITGFTAQRASRSAGSRSRPCSGTPRAGWWPRRVVASLPDAELLSESKMLLREVATRPSPTEALRQFVGMAQGSTAEARRRCQSLIRCHQLLRRDFGEVTFGGLGTPWARSGALSTVRPRCTQRDAGAMGSQRGAGDRGVLEPARGRDRSSASARSAAARAALGRGSGRFGGHARLLATGQCAAAASSARPRALVTRWVRVEISSR